jgi:hypothetical protein
VFRIGNTASLALVVVAWAATTGVAAAAYEYDAHDFASEVVSYTGGGSSYNDPDTALGRPTIDTAGDGWDVLETTAAVVPVYPPWKDYEIVSVQEGGQLTVKFDHKVVDDPDNPYGIDVIIFGNSMQQITGGGAWENGDPNLTTVAGTASGEPGNVSVSQNGSNWYAAAGSADTFPPTLGRIYDTENPDPALDDPETGYVNYWWGHATDPTLPLNPSLTPGSFNGDTVAEMAEAYGESAGGTGFDVGGITGLPADPQTGTKWFQYVRIENPASSGITPEIDALADVAPHEMPGDVDKDGLVGNGDFARVLGNWDAVGSGVHTWAEGDLNDDGKIDQDDFQIIVDHWAPLPNGLGGASLPEPATLITLAAGAMVLARSRRKG